MRKYGYIISMAAFVSLNILNEEKVSIIGGLITILVLSIFMLKSNKSFWEKRTLKSSYSVISLLICSLLASNFYITWESADKIKAISDFIGVGTKELVWGIAIIGAIVAIPITSVMLFHLVTEGKAFLAKNQCNLELEGVKTLSSCKAFLILTLIFMVAISAILRANFNYIDDMGRIAEGGKGWENFSRFLSNGLATLIYMNSYITDISPLMQIIAVLLLALGGIILLNVVYERKKFTFWEIVALIPLGLNPYFLECISYKFDSPFMALSILASIFPLIFRKSSSWIYIFASAIGTIIMCTTYQASSGIFPMVVMLIMLRMWMQKANIRQLVKFIIQSIIGFVVGLLFFRMVIMVPIDDYVSNSLPEVTRLFSTVINNLIKYYDQIILEFNPLWLGMTFLIFIGFLWSGIKITKQNKLFTFAMMVITLFMLLIVCFGLYPALNEPLFQPRAMYGFGVLVTILCICVVEKCQLSLIQFPVVLISWLFLIFSLTYGNALYVQKTYTDFRITQVISDLNDMEIFAKDDPVTVQISGNIGFSPIVQSMSTHYSILNRLIPVTFQESWVWGLKGFYEYYGLKNVVWDDSQEIKVSNLPMIKDGMYHSIYGNETSILIVLK